MEPTVKELVGLFIVGVPFIVWLVRLEGKVFSLKDSFKLLMEENENTHKEVDSIRNRQEVVDNELSKELKSIQVELAQIKGYLMHTGKMKYNPKG